MEKPHAIYVNGGGGCWKALLQGCGLMGTGETVPEALESLAETMKLNRVLYLDQPSPREDLP